MVNEKNEMGWIQLTPWFSHEPWRTVVLESGRQLRDRPGPTGTDRPAGGCRAAPEDSGLER